MMTKLAWLMATPACVSLANLHIPELEDDQCDLHFFRSLPGAYMPSCRRPTLPHVRLRRRNNTAGSFKWEAVILAKDQFVQIVKLPRSYKIADTESDSTTTGPGLMPITDAHEAVQVFYNEAGRDGDEVMATDLLFTVRRDFFTFPVWPAMLNQRARRPDVYVIILDSVSRRTLRRFAPSIHAIFQRDQAYHHAFSFPNFHTICGGGTLGTVYPMLHGGIGVHSTPAWCSEGLSDKPAWTQNYSTLAECYDPKRRILKLARDAGFVAALSTNLLLQLYNDEHDPHHATCPALCNLTCLQDPPCIKRFDYANDIARCSDHICFGRDRYAKKIFNFNEEVFAQYSDHSKFLLSMLHGAHNDPQDLSILERDLWVHFQSMVFAKMSDFRDSVVVLMGDHGRKTVACDYTDPFLGVLVPRSWSASAAGRAALEAIQSNAEFSAAGMLVTPWDLYASLRHLIAWGGGGAYDGEDDHFGLREVSQYGEIQSHTEMRGRKFLRHMKDFDDKIVEHEAFARFRINGQFSPKSIFAKMSPKRSCEEAGVAPTHCVQGVEPVAFYTCENEVRRRLAWERQTCLRHARSLAPGGFRLTRIIELESSFAEERLSSIVAEAFPGLLGERDSQPLLAFMDIDGDGIWSSAEVLPILAAGPARSGTSSLPETLKSFWCSTGTSRALRTIRTMNRAYTQGSQGICKMFSLLRLDRVMVSQAKAGSSSSRKVSMSFTVGQGEPASRYELTLALTGDSNSSRYDASLGQSWKTGTLHAVTRYHKYQACTPKGLEAEFCVCT